MPLRARRYARSGGANEISLLEESIVYIFHSLPNLDDVRFPAPNRSALTAAVVQEMWDRCFLTAKREAEGDMNQAAAVTELSRYGVFEEPYEKK